MTSWWITVALALALTTTRVASAQVPAPGAADNPTAAPSVSPHPALQPPTGVSKQIAGTIQAVQGDKITLADGTQLTIPGSVMVQQQELQPGASVKASYEDRGGEKVVTSLQIDLGK